MGCRNGLLEFLMAWNILEKGGLSVGGQFFSNTPSPSVSWALSLQHCNKELTILKLLAVLVLLLYNTQSVDSVQSQVHYKLFLDQVIKFGFQG